MAALQNRGGFGAPPPIAPKPAFERPKWKPPPVVAPVDKDDDDVPSQAHTSKSPPPVRKLSLDLVNPEESTSTAEGADGEADPEEEERQRRAAIAARMARLGGARVGMAPAFGPKPVVKKPESVEEPVEAEEAPSVQTDDTAIVPPPPIESAQEPAQVSESSDKPSVSEVTSQHSPEIGASPGSRSLASMPIPSAPRRAAPPRRKTPKSPEVPPPVVATEMSETSARDVDTVEADAPTVPATYEVKPTIDDGVVDDVTEVKDKVAEDSTTTSPDNIPIFPGEHSRESLDVTEGAREHHSSPIVVEEPTQSQKDMSDPDITAAIPQEVDIADHEEIATQETTLVHDEAPVQSSEQEISHVSDDLPSSKVEDVSSTQTLEETVEDEEAARRQRIAEKLAKMGGINPFALPQRKSSVSSEDASTSPPPKRASFSRESISSPPPPLQRRESTRKSSLDTSTVFGASLPIVAPITVEEPELSIESQDDSMQDMPNSEPIEAEAAAVAAPMRFLEETEVDDTEEAEYSANTAGTADVDNEQPRKTREKDETTVDDEKSKYHNLASALTQGVIDEPEAASAAPTVRSSATPPAVTAFTPAVDPVLPVDPAPLPVRYAEPINAPPTLPPARSLPPPPPRLVAEPNEIEDDVSDSEAGYSPAPHVPPSEDPSEVEEEEQEPLRRPPLRSVPTEDTNDDESVPLPVPNRRSLQAERQAGTTLAGLGASAGGRVLSARPFRAIPTTPVSAQVSDVESDFDEVLPTRPRHRPMTPASRPMTPGAPPTNEIPLIVPPPTVDESAKRVEPSPLRKTSYTDNVQTIVIPAHRMGDISPSLLSPPLSASEVLDDEEGDPIDPAFYSPSRRGSTITLPATGPVEPTSEPEEDEAAVRRRTIAERMAKLGGIKFGAAPPVTIRQIPPPPRQQEEGEIVTPEAQEEHPIEPIEEEERARKERIAAKLAGMGGMRIGMMPLGVGVVRPQASHILTEETSARAAPPSHPVPPSEAPQDSDIDPESSLSASQLSFGTSDEGVKVEAEESEIEEVNYSDAQETLEEPEEIPPPIPARGPRRRGTGSESDHTSTSLPVRPPVPSTLPNRRASGQSATPSGRRSSADSTHSIQHRASYKPPQSEYVMVEEPNLVPDEEVAPLPPPRPTSRPPPRSAPPPPPPTVSSPVSDSISSQWEMPSISASTLEFSETTDLSLSWPDDSNPTLLSSPPPPPPPPSKSPVVQQQITTASVDLPRSSDDLMAVWGRVGVQICEVATTLFEQSKKSLVGDGTYDGFVQAVLREVPNVTMSSTPGAYGYLVYMQTGNAVQKRASEILPGDVITLQDAKLKGHKGLQMYHQNVGVGEQLVGIVSEFEPKKSKVRVFQANQHVGQQTVEAASYRLEDLKSGTVKVYRVLEN